MSDFDLSLVVRAEDQGAVATADALTGGIDKISAAQGRSSAASEGAAQSTRKASDAFSAAGMRADAARGKFDSYSGATKKVDDSAKELERRQRNVAAAINQVVRATDPAISNQNLLDAAVRRVQAAFIQGKVGAETYARAQDIASRATFNSAQAMNAHARASGGSRIAQMEMMHVVRASVDQFAVGTPLLQIFTMHLAQLAQAYSFSAMSATDNARAAEGAAGASRVAAGAMEAEAAAAATAAEESVAGAAAAVANTAATATNAAATTGAAGAKIAEAEAGGVATVALEANTVATVENAVATEGAAVASRGFAGFMAGPWGMAVIAAVTIIGTLTSHLLAAGDAADETAARMKTLATSADFVSAAQSTLGSIVEMVTGKFDNQNVTLREAIRLQAILAQQAAYKGAQTAGKKLFEAGGSIEGKPGEGFGFITPGGTATGGPPESAETRANQEAFYALVRNYRNNPKASVSEFRGHLEKWSKAGMLQGLDVNAALEQALNIAVARGQYSTNKDIQSVAEGGPMPDYLKKDPPKTRTRHPRQKKTPDLTMMGLNVGEQIRTIEAGFTDTPPQVEKVRHSLAELDKIMVELAKKKPPNFEALIAQAKEAKTVVAEGLNKPFNDFILKQNDSLAVQKLLTAGQSDQADALKIILDLERQQGPLTDRQKDGVLATVQAIRAEQRETEILHEKQQKYLTAIGQVKSAIQDAIADPVKGIADLPKKLIASFTQLKAAKIFENLFGDTFREIEDKITGANVAKDAAARMADAVDGVTAQTNRTTTALDSLANAASAAAGAVGGGGSLSEPGSRLADLDAVVNGLPGGGGGQGAGLAAAGGVASTLASLARGRPITNAARQEGDPIVVTGSRSTASQFGGWIEKLSKGVGISDKAAASIGKMAGKGIEGAATGALVNSVMAPLGKALGIRTSQTGAEIGGAIGSFIPIPGGQIIGSIAGSLLGGLLTPKPKPKSGGAVITSAFDPFSATGNNADAKKVAGGAAGDVQSAIANIAQQLGGTPGSFKISIGEADGKWSVDPLGLNRSAKPGKGGVAFGDDQAGATAFAIQTAIAQGAVSGLSKAVAAALQSSPDVNKALAEAINVKNLETLIGGVGGALRAQFETFNATAAERVRLAKKYGLDLLAVEKINGEQRAKLVDDITKARIGDLLDLQKSLTYGDLSEGDAATRRSSILAEIGKVAPDAEAGKDGSASSLADLYRQLVSTSRDAYGTAGSEYASDRASAQDEIARVIQLENDRIAAAQKAQDDVAAALTTNNSLTNETNDLIAIGNSKLDAIIVAFGTSMIGGDASYGGGLARFTDIHGLSY